MQIETLKESHPNIFLARANSAKKLDRLRRNMVSIPPGVTVVANGSLARGEITSQSDFDAYPLYIRGSKAAAGELFASIKDKSGLREFSADGAFGEPVPAATLRRRIGGQGDDNRRFTRRMLFLLESTSIGNSKLYDSTLSSLVSRYINDDITDKQICRFLLNDIVRFYRTMCVDFEFKTVEHPKPKPWGIRYTKLIFSRKMIYYSGLVMCAEMAGLPAARKRERLLELIRIPPIDRLLDTLDTIIVPALREYDSFLGLLNDPSIRADLSRVGMLRETHTPKFKEVKASGHRFSSLLVEALREKYGQQHPIHEAVVV